MPAVDRITDLGWQMIEDLPPILRDDPDTQASLHCQAKEAERMDAAAREVAAGFNPLTATNLTLPIWERVMHLPPGPPDEGLRRARVVARWRSLQGNPSGRSWIERLNERIGISWAYEEHIPGDAGSPPAQTLRITLPVQPGPNLAEKERIFREETPSELALIFTTGEGFLLDLSQMDVETMR